jgi:hypothetical protein
MQRLKDYIRIIAWQAGLGYLLLWGVTFWTLDEGPTVFGKSGVCVPDEAKVLFYWVCDPSSPLTVLASIANAALTATVWAPVYLAAATAQPEAAAIAVPIIMLHVVGLPLGLLFLVRLLAAVFDLRQRIGARYQAPPQLVPAAALPAEAAPTASAAPPAPVAVRPTMSPRPTVKPRSEFGLRGQSSEQR